MSEPSECFHDWVDITTLDGPRTWACTHCGARRWEPHDTEGTA